MLPTLRYYLEERTRYAPAGASEAEVNGWVTLDLPFDSFVTPRKHLLSLGQAVGV